MKRERVTSELTSKSVSRPLGCGLGRESLVGPLPHGRGTVGRTAFTLIELLVVVTIMLILIAMTVTALDFTNKAERVRSAARQLQSALEGARDRAIFAGKPRGLRLIIDPVEPRMVSTVVYIGSPDDYWRAGQIRLERLDVVNNVTGAAGGDGIADTEDANGNNILDPGEDTNNNGVLDTQRIVIARGDAATGWLALKERGFLGVFEDLNLNGVLDAGEDQNGNGVLDVDAPRIRIPKGKDGTWYTVLTHRLTAANQILELLTPYRDVNGATDPPSQVVAFQGSAGPSKYELELPPRILRDARPILLPEKVVIDLDGSAVPASWRPGQPDPAMPLDQQRLKPYSPHMDIMFSPRGVVTGPLAATGILHLYLAQREDVVRVVDEGVNLDSGSPTRRSPRFAGDLPLAPGADQFGMESPIGNRMVLSIFTQTGKVSTHQFHEADAYNNFTGAAGADGFADAPFLFATQGEGQAQ